MPNQTIRTIALSFLLIGCLGLPFTAQAEKTKETAAKTKEEKPFGAPRKKEKGEDRTKEINKKIAEFIQDLDEPDTQHFLKIYSSYNIIETVKIVQEHVGTAIKSCGDNNPPMKKQLKTRYKNWKKDINPIIKEAEGNYKNMMIAQDYADKKKLEETFDFIEEVRTQTQNKFKRIPVKSKESCEYLLNKMDNTQSDLISMLQSSLTATLSSTPIETKPPQQSTPKDEKTPEKNEEKSEEKTTEKEDKDPKTEEK